MNLAQATPEQLIAELSARLHVQSDPVTAPTFAARIVAMNTMYKLPQHVIPTLPADPADRLAKFKRTLQDEVNEIDELIQMAAAMAQGAEPNDPARLMTGIADLLADVQVYCRSEALKYGIPHEDVLDIVMDSNESKLGADGKPIYNNDGKFLKGPNYWKPEPKIAARLSAGCGVQQGDWK